MYPAMLLVTLLVLAPGVYTQLLSPTPGDAPAIQSPKPDLNPAIPAPTPGNPAAKPVITPVVATAIVPPTATGAGTPPASVPMGDAAMRERAKDFAGVTYKLVLVGDKKYVLPDGYTQQGSLYYNFVTKPDDVILVSYPRSGTSWFSQLLYQLVNKIPGIAVKPQTAEALVPLLESILKGEGAVSSLPVDTLPSPRVIRTQLPPSLIPTIITGGKKVIYLARNPKDVIVSAYEYTKQIANFTGTIDKYFYYIQNDITLYCPYWAHLKEGLSLDTSPNVLIVYAEERAEAIPKLVKFLEVNLTTEELQRLTTYMGALEPIDLVSWPKSFSPVLNKAVNDWIIPNIGEIKFPNIPNLYA